MARSNLISTVRRSEEGTAVVETAFALPILLFFALGFVDFAIGFSEKLKLQQHANSSAEIIVASFYDVPDDDTIKSELSTMSGIKKDDIILTRTYECEGTAVGALDECGGLIAKPEEYLQVDITKDYVPALTYFGFETVELSGSVIIRLDGEDSSSAILP